MYPKMFLSFASSQILYSPQKIDSHLAITLQACVELGGKKLHLVGFDGYKTLNAEKKFFSCENQTILDYFKIKNQILRLLV